MAKDIFKLVSIFLVICLAFFLVWRYWIAKENKQAPVQPKQEQKQKDELPQSNRDKLYLI